MPYVNESYTFVNNKPPRLHDPQPQNHHCMDNNTGNPDSAMHLFNLFHMEILTQNAYAKKIDKSRQYVNWYLKKHIAKHGFTGIVDMCKGKHKAEIFMSGNRVMLKLV